MHDRNGTLEVRDPSYPGWTTRREFTRRTGIEPGGDWSLP